MPALVTARVVLGQRARHAHLLARGPQREARSPIQPVCVGREALLQPLRASNWWIIISRSYVAAWMRAASSAMASPPWPASAPATSRHKKDRRRGIPSAPRSPRPQIPICSLVVCYHALANRHPDDGCQFRMVFGLHPYRAPGPSNSRRVVPSSELLEQARAAGRARFAGGAQGRFVGCEQDS